MPILLQPSLTSSRPSTCHCWPSCRNCREYCSRSRSDCSSSDLTWQWQAWWLRGKGVLAGAALHARRCTLLAAAVKQERSTAVLSVVAGATPGRYLGRFLKICDRVHALAFLEPRNPAKQWGQHSKKFLKLPSGCRSKGQKYINRQLPSLV